MNNFKSLNEKLLPNARTLLQQWLSNGQVSGNRFEVGDIYNSKGDSLKIDLSTGKWFDFANPEHKGGDLISLYAKIKNIKPYEALKELGGVKNKYTTQTIMNKNELTNPLSEESSYSLNLDYKNDFFNPWYFEKFCKSNLGNNCFNFKYGFPVKLYYYFTESSKEWLHLVIARYEYLENNIQKKSFTPFCFDGAKFVRKMLFNPRPLYGLELLKDNPDLPILLVEGEKAAEGARFFIKSHIVLSWPGGCNGVEKVDLSPILDRKEILLWPDNDDAGMKAMEKLASILNTQSSVNPSINILLFDETFKNKKATGWDAFDAYSEAWNQNTFEKFVEKFKTPFVKKITDAEIIDGRYEISVPKNMVAELKEDMKLWEPLGLVLNQKQRPYPNELNLIKIITHWDKLSRDFIWFDEFHQKLFTKGINGDEDKKEWSEFDILPLLIKIQSELKIHQINKNTLNDVVLNYAYNPENVRNEAVEYLQSLEWDGVSRVDKFFIDYYGSEDNEYTRAIGKNLLIGITARIVKPGCKLDTMVVIEGAQGIKKSTSLKYLVGQDWYAETNISPDSKDFYMQLQGKAIVEIGELNSFGKAEITSIKQMLSCQSDRFRVPFGKTMKDYPRQCVFAGTTNDSTYLKDTTGNRRFWPVRATNIDTDKIIQDRDQLFAESYYRFKQGESWWEVPQLIAEKEQDTRLMALEDEWYDLVKDFIEGRSRVKIREIAQHKELNLENKDINRIIQLRIAGILKALGWENRVINLKNEYGLFKTERYWMRKDHPSV